MKENNQIKYELMRLMALDSFVSSFSLLLIITITATLFWQETIKTYLTLWEISIFIVLAIRSYHAKQFLKHDISLQKIDKIFTLLTLLSALLVGIGFSLLFTISDYVHQIYIIIFIAGISAGSVIALSYFKKLSIGYLSLLLIPFFYAPLTQETDTSYTLSYLIILFFIILSLFSVKYNKNITNTLLSKNNFKSIFEEIPIGVFTYNKDLIITQTNKAFAKILHVPKEKLLELDMKTLKDISILEPLQKVFNNEKVSYEGAYHTTLTGLDLWAQLNAIPMYDANGNIISGLGIVKDITKEKQNQKKLEYQAFYDSLTGLTNRASFRSHLEQFMKKLHRSKEYGVLFFIDLDDFKNINDSIGHDVGDYVLQEFSKRVRNILRAEDIFARLGGDEFVILLSQTYPDLAKTKKIALHLSEKIHAVLKKPIKKADDIFYVSLSIGIKILKPEEIDTNTILKHADIAMYKSKKDGKNRTSFYNSTINKQAQ